MSTHFSDKYPPKNRQRTAVDSIVDVEVQWAEGLRRMDLNEACIAAQRESIPLGTPCRPSDISGKPGYIYRTSDMELALTRDELYRFMRFNLDAQEFFVLAERFGVCFELHDDFYNEDTGKALQPKYGPRDAETFFQKCLGGEERPEAIDEYVECWHKAKEEDLPLHRFLGMTWEEYSAWAANPASLYKLLFERLRDVGAA